jgi:flagellar basal-body rod protein FlgB
MDFLTSTTQKAVAKAMDGVALRHQAIASNLANVETPGYARRDVQFENALSNALGMQQKTGDQLPMLAPNPKHIGFTGAFNTEDALGAVTPEMTVTKGNYRVDGNAVDVDNEMVALARNTERFMALAHIEGKMFKGLRNVITSGGGMS